MKTAFVAFSPRGEALARLLAEDFPGALVERGYGREDFSLSPWTAEAFSRYEGLVFVGAAGIAVRAIAPFVRDKTRDPAVVAVDETGAFVIPLLSGHLGGGNDLARLLAARCGGVPVVTTATDRRGVFPVDQWARTQKMAVLDPQKIKGVSSALLAGEKVTFWSRWPIAGEMPKGLEAVSDRQQAQIVVDLSPKPAPGLRLAPRILTLGVGCRKGTSRQALETAFSHLMGEQDLAQEAVAKVATIDLKQEEPGLLAFCEARRLTLKIFTAQELLEAEGDFSSSAFVRQVTGVDNVCERSAVLGGGRLLVPKTKGDGITMALAVGDFHPDWRIYP